jgi:hypothetical protein
MSPPVLTLLVRKLKFLNEESPEGTRNYRRCQKNLAVCDVSEASSLCPLGKEQSKDTTPTQRDDVAVGWEACRRIGRNRGWRLGVWGSKTAFRQDILTRRSAAPAGAGAPCGPSKPKFDLRLQRKIDRLVTRIELVAPAVAGRDFLRISAIGKRQNSQKQQ